MNEELDIKLSIILPIYNSADFLSDSLMKMDSFIQSLDYSTELIIVDDGSKDESLKIAKEFDRKSHPYTIKVVALGKNEGKGAAVAKGMLSASGKYRVFLDIDLAYPPSQINKIVAALEEGIDVAVASRVMPESRYTISPAFFHYLYTRHLASRVLNFILRKTLTPHCKDTQAGLKGFSADAANKLFSRLSIKGFPFDIEAIFIAEKMGMRIREIPVEFRYFNEPTTVEFMNDSLGMARDIAKIRLNHAHGRYLIPNCEEKKRIIVNADDFGMTLPVSRGILKANEGKILKSTSAMTTSRDFEASMELVGSDSLDIGFHANLTWGHPLTEPYKIKTLVGKNGKFLDKATLIKRTNLGQINQEEVYTELKAQCTKLHEKIKNITHMDGHHHVHVYPIVRNAVEQIAREFNIPYIRSPREGKWSPWRWAILRRLAIGNFASSAPQYWRSRGFHSIERFAGFALGSNKNMKDRWIKTLSRFPNGTGEIMVHPGFPSADGDSYNFERQDEIEALLDKEICETAKSASIEFISFKDLLGGAS